MASVADNPDYNSTSPSLTKTTGRVVFGSLPQPSHLAPSTGRLNSQPIHEHDEEDSDKENNPGAMKVPISAPVPVSYASLGKGGLRSLLSMGDEDMNTPPDEIDAHVCSEILPALADVGAFEPTDYTFAAVPQIIFPSKEGTERPIPSVTIRPISPSTLMALTEPCLMAWCYELDEDDHPASIQIQAPTTVPDPPPDLYYLTQDPVYAQMQYSMGSGVTNLWGY